MRSRISIIALTLLAGLSLPVAATAGTGDKAQADLQNAAGQSIGTVEFEQTPHGTLVHAHLKNLPEGTHAFHVHGTGKCKPSFKSAGGHFNPGNKKHGYQAADGYHAGDFPNIHVPENGKLEIEYFNPSLKLDDKLFDADGAAVVIHEGTDDYKTNPAGAAGTRIGCGVIKRKD